MNYRRVAWVVLAWTVLHSASASASGLHKETVGDVVMVLLGAGTLGYTYRKDDLEGRGQLILSSVTSYGVNGVFRVIYKESYGKRPNGHEYGFPSGHAGFMGAMSGFLLERYGWQVGVPAYAATGYVSYVRVDTDHHRWRDIVAALVIAQGFAMAMVTPYSERTTIEPLIGDDRLGVRVRYQW